jgi:hypothetical protein
MPFWLCIIPNSAESRLSAWVFLELTRPKPETFGSINTNGWNDRDKTKCNQQYLFSTLLPRCAQNFRCCQHSGGGPGPWDIFEKVVLCTARRWDVVSHVDLNCCLGWSNRFRIPLYPWSGCKLPNWGNWWHYAVWLSPFSAGSSWINTARSWFPSFEEVVYL